MMKPSDVFISYSSKNVFAADALVNCLEEGRIRCWIAPRDIPGGEVYAEVIDEAIESSKLFLILFSRDAQMSQFVRKEVELAVSCGKIVIPVRLEDVLPRKAMRFYFAKAHWVDLFPHPEANFGKVIKAVRAALSLNEDEHACSWDSKKCNRSYTWFNRKLVLGWLGLVLFLSGVVALVRWCGNSFGDGLRIKSVGDVRWTYTVDSNEVSVGGQDRHYQPLQAVSKGTSGPLNIPSAIDNLIVTRIGEYAFLGCTNLTVVTIPMGVMSVGRNAFSYCEKMSSIEIPSSVTQIGSYAFAWCRSLKTVAVPSRVERVEDCVFENCESLATVMIPPSVKSIGKFAFSGCRSLTALAIPSSVMIIKDSAFLHCDELVKVYVNAGDGRRVMEMMANSGVDIGKISFVEQLLSPKVK